MTFEQYNRIDPRIPEYLFRGAREHAADVSLRLEAGQGDVRVKRPLLARESELLGRALEAGGQVAQARAGLLVDSRPQHARALERGKRPCAARLELEGALSGQRCRHPIAQGK